MAKPGEDLPAGYFTTRYQTLRQPLGFPSEAEHIADDGQAIHAWVEVDGEVVAVGRAHLIPPDEDGSASDHAGADAATCPAFAPLNGAEDFPAPDELRPAFQIRQMGTLDEWRRQGCARDILELLEAGALAEWGCVSGWLQARVPAIAFYQSRGWTSYGATYEVEGIGAHISMYKLSR
jgi:GNAT superfamily N-acetyltransferase